MIFTPSLSQFFSILLVLLATGTPVGRAEETCAKPKEALELIRAVDKVFYADSRESLARLEIKKGSRTRTIRMKSYVRGGDEAYTEVLEPARDRGTKFLKLKDEMWIYTPEADKILKIAGHMLRKGMLGSDFSYEDAMDDRTLEEVYQICWLAEKDADFPNAAVIELTARIKELTYFRRRLVIDPESKLLHREERFARSGKKLKVMTVENYRPVAGAAGETMLQYPRLITIKDLLRSDSETVMITEEIKLNTKIDPEIFTRQKLRR